MTKYNWLVEIRVRHNSKVFDYIEVEAPCGIFSLMEDIPARNKAIELLERRARYEPSFKSRLRAEGLTLADLHVPVAVVID